MSKKLTKNILPTICPMAYMESAIMYNPGLTNLFIGKFILNFDGKITKNGKGLNHFFLSKVCMG